MVVVAIVSIVLILFSMWCIGREIFFIDDYEYEEHGVLPLLIYLSAFHIAVFYWFYYRKGFENGFVIEKIDLDFGILLFFIVLVSSSITRIFRKIRKGESKILNYKDEIKNLVKTKEFGLDSNIE